MEPNLPDETRDYLAYDKLLRDGHVSTCCVGMPTYTYLVACLEPKYPHDRDEFWYYEKIQGPPFDDRCVAVAGRCGPTCGVAAKSPLPELCNAGGSIKTADLVSEKTAQQWGMEPGNLKKSKHHRWRDNHFQLTGVKLALHILFVFMMTIMGTSAWVTFLPGTGGRAEVFARRCWSCRALSKRTASAVQRCKNQRRYGREIGRRRRYRHQQRSVAADDAGGRAAHGRASRDAGSFMPRGVLHLGLGAENDDPAEPLRQDAGLGESPTVRV